jgi:cytidyltransferase-like protein
MKRKKVFASGCFDLLHAGHVEFLKNASKFGELYVSLGSDKNVKMLKEINPTYSQEERLFILNNLKSVKKAFISEGMGIMDFVEDLKKIKPDVFVVNEDGHTKEKEGLCKSLGIEYKVLKRTPKKGLPPRSSTQLRAKKSKIPYRIDLAGAWLDQPKVSTYHPGPVLTISIEPSEDFNLRSGMASSTRKSAMSLWGDSLPNEDPLVLAKTLFNFDNPPWKSETAGSQDSIGMIVPALKYAYYAGEYWPKTIKIIKDEKVLSWLEDKIYLIPLEPRNSEYDPYKAHNFNKENAKELADAAEECFKAIMERDMEAFSRSFTESFNAQVKLFPSTLPRWILPIIEKYKKLGAKGWKLSGAGGGGYLILVSDVSIKDAIRVKIRRA